MPIEVMLCIYFLQQWYTLSDPGAEEALYDMESMHRFVQLDLQDGAISDETTILNFRRLIEKHELSLRMFRDINEYLALQGISVSKGTMVDVTIIHALSSTKNKAKERDPDMKSIRKNKQYFFGMKVHIGTDLNSNVIHSATVTSANIADITELPNLFRDDDQVISGDASYTSDSYNRGARHLGMTWKVYDKRKPRKNLSTRQKKRNRKNSQIRVRVEHCFRVMKY